MTENEAKLAQRTARFLKAELKRADVTYGRNWRGGSRNTD